MSDLAAAAAPVTAPPVSAEAKAPVVTKVPEVEPTEEYEIDGAKVALTKTQAKTELQKRIAADKRFKEAADIRHKAEDILKSFDGDIEDALKKLGKDPEKIFAEHLAKKAKQALMTPEQIEAERLKAELATLRSEKEKTEAEKKAASIKEADARNSKAMESQLIAAADKYNLDSTPETLEGLCDVAVDLLDYGVGVPTVDQIAQEYIRREAEHIETHSKKKLSKLEGKKLLEYLGNPTLEKVKAALAAMDAESLKAIPQPVAKRREVAAPAARPRDEKGKYLRESDFDKKFGI